MGEGEMTTKQRIEWYRLGSALMARENMRRERQIVKRRASLRNAGEQLNAWGATPLSAYL